MMEERTKEDLEKKLDDTQYGLRKVRCIQDSIFIIRQAIDKSIDKSNDIHIHMFGRPGGKPFHRIRRQAISKTLIKGGIEERLIDVISNIRKD